MGLAARGSRQLGDTIEQIDNAAELAQVRWQARRLQLKSLAVAIVLTLAALVIP